MTVVNIRGTNGSGKTFLVRGLLGERETYRSWDAPLGTPLTVNREETLCALGDYTKEGCTGCDQISTQDEICAAVQWAYRTFPNVVFEGIIVSTIFTRYLRVSQTLQGGTWWWYLQTPPAECYQRLLQRSKNPGAIKWEQVINKWVSIERTRLKALKAGERVRKIPGNFKSGKTFRWWNA
jgi:hypothetical protein